MMMKKKKKEGELLVVQQINEDCWRVKNATKGTEYTVTRQRVDSWECTCPHFQYRARRCKHINAVIEQEEYKHNIKHEEIAKERTEDLMILD